MQSHIKKFCAKSVNIRKKRACAVTYSQHCQGSNFIGLAVHLLASATQGHYVQIPGTNPRGTMCLANGVSVEVQAHYWVANQWLVFCPSLCGGGSSNLESPDHGTAIVNHRLRQLLFCNSSQWGTSEKRTAFSISLHGWTLIGQPKISSKWPQCWWHRICVKIRLRQRELRSARCHFV